MWQVVQRSLAPSFNETHSLICYEEEPSLYVQLWDADPFEDDSLGKVGVTVRGATRGCHRGPLMGSHRVLIRPPSGAHSSPIRCSFLSRICVVANPSHHGTLSSPRVRLNSD